MADTNKETKETQGIKSATAREFYADSLKILKKNNFAFLIGGTVAVNVYTGIDRQTKDMDIFCRPGDYPKIVNILGQEGVKVSVEDERWLAKGKKGNFFYDIIFGSSNVITPITDQWFKESQMGNVFGVEVNLIPPTELVWSKFFVQDRYKYDGSDIAHLILTQHKQIHWKRLLHYADQYWEVLLIHILNFRFIYPSEREHVPGWLIDELLTRLKDQREAPTSKMKVCRGRLFSRGEYEVDVTKFGFADLIGGQKKENGKK